MRAKTFLEAYKDRRIHWKRVCAEWNEKHPHDPMNPAVLKVRYYRAIAEEDIQREYYRRTYHEEISGVAGEMLNDGLKIISEVEYHMGLFSDSARASIIESVLPKDFTGLMEAWREAHPATANWQQIKAQEGSKLLQALNKVWYQGGTLTPDEEMMLKQLHGKYPFGQPDFTIWLEQTLKQIFEKSVNEEKEGG